jgi:hypothetical protein
MSTTFTTVTPILGVNLEGNEAAAGTSDGTSGAPRVAVLTPVSISGGRIALYAIAKTALNPGATVMFDSTAYNSGGTVSATTATCDYVTLNTSTAATAEYIWVRSLLLQN